MHFIAWQRNTDVTTNTNSKQKWGRQWKRTVREMVKVKKKLKALDDYD